MPSQVNKQAILIKNLADSVRETHEVVKFIFYSQDDSEGAKLLMEDTRKNPFFRARFLNPDALSIRESFFPKKQ